MEKINREELMKKLNLTEEELEKVAGGVFRRYYLRRILSVDAKTTRTTMRRLG